MVGSQTNLYCTFSQFSEIHFLLCCVLDIKLCFV
uniref:Uncharacterized protein n=1 Tax=Anguilla anguilla TaxID=7936 RepID=A0A0E9U5V8_ANGAN